MVLEKISQNSPYIWLNYLGALFSDGVPKSMMISDELTFGYDEKMNRRKEAAPLYWFLINTTKFYWLLS